MPESPSPEAARNIRTETHLSPPRRAIRPKPVKPPKPSKLTKTPINTGDLYFQNLA